jgi:hypothetical protein
MANETTTTTVTEAVMPEMITPLIMDYAYDQSVLAQFARYQSLVGMNTKVASFPKWTKNSTESVAEAASFSNVALDTSEVSATVAQVGILREVTKLALRTNILGEGGLEAFIVRDGARLVAETIDNDLFALFPSITLSVGTTTQDMTLADFALGLAKRRIAMAKGSVAFVGHVQQVYDLQAAQLTATGTVWSNPDHQGLLEAASDSNGYAGALFRCPVWFSNLADTANAGADVVGAWVNYGVPEATMGLAQLWAAEVEIDSDITKLTRKWCINECHGVALINNAVSVKAVTDAP